ncbi:MAG: Stp1/IreP family PP2C-type Ser/Thr phosphatase [Acidimicrobiales bacterium]|jgi:PPM family protein phosphatase|nr:Stp1/IreP family PP2C-type Ser/Thr phosphatase [Acidimicrobiales bacterium]
MSESRSINEERDPMSIFSWGSATDTGNLRTINQDFYATSNTLFIVADGMGGHASGELASEIAIRTVLQEREYITPDDFGNQIRLANEAVRSEANNNPDHKGMGTTLCGITQIHSNEDVFQQLAIANIGDSRVYLLSRDSFSQITQDHSLVEEMFLQGKITADQAAVHPNRNVITRALGIDDDASVDCWHIPARKGDRFLLCTDGLTNEVSDTEISETLQTYDNPQEAALRLVSLANQNEGKDNITVVVVDVIQGSDVDFPTEFPPSPISVGPETERDTQSPNPEFETAASSITPEWEPTPRNILKLAIAVLSLLLVIGVFIGRDARDNYFVTFEQTENISVDNSQILIFKGQPNSVLWFDPTIEERIPILGLDLDEETVSEIQKKPEFDTLEDAQIFIDDLKGVIEKNRQRTD